jgi:hypothetical protein
MIAIFAHNPIFVSSGFDIYTSIHPGYQGLPHDTLSRQPTVLPQRQDHLPKRLQFRESGRSIQRANNMGPFHLLLHALMPTTILDQYPSCTIMEKSCGGMLHSKFEHPSTKLEK